MIVFLFCFFLNCKSNLSWKFILLCSFVSQIVSTSFWQQVLCGGWYSSDCQCKPQRPGCVHMCGKNSSGQRYSFSAAHGVRWGNLWAIFLLWVKGSVNPCGAALMYDTSINGSRCQETKAGHEHADHGFIIAVPFLTITLLRYFRHFNSKRNSGSLMHLVPHPLALGMIWLSICSLGLFCCRDWCVCDFPKPCCCDGFQTSLMHLNTWYCLNTRAKVWNWNGSPGTITTAQPQVKRKICVCRCRHIQYITHCISASCSVWY